MSYLANALSNAPAKVEIGAKRDDIGGMLWGSVDNLAAILDDINREIGNRRLLSTHMSGAIQDHYQRVKAKLYEMDQFPISSNRAVEQRRLALEQMLDTLVAEERRENIERWQDIGRLKTELRGWQKQYADLIQRISFVAGNKWEKTKFGIGPTGRSRSGSNGSSRKSRLRIGNAEGGL